MKRKAIDEQQAKLIYMERLAVQYRYDTNPNDPTLIATANYLFSLLNRFQLQARAIIASQSVALPIVGGPSSVNILVGQDGVFTITVSSTVPYTIQWYDSTGTAIAGAVGLSYTFPNAQLTDTGKSFYAQVKNSAGMVKSNTAVMVVTQALTGQYYFGDTDYYTQLKAGTDNVPYNGAFPVTNGQPLVVPFPLAAANNKSLVVKYPDSQSDKSAWQNTVTNFGTIPDQAYMEIVAIAPYKYIISRGQISLDSTQTSVTYS